MTPTIQPSGFHYYPFITTLPIELITPTSGYPQLIGKCTTKGLVIKEEEQLLTPPLSCRDIISVSAPSIDQEAEGGEMEGSDDEGSAGSKSAVAEEVEGEEEVGLGRFERILAYLKDQHRPLRNENIGIKDFVHIEDDISSITSPPSSPSLLPTYRSKSHRIKPITLLDIRRSRSRSISQFPITHPKGILQPQPLDWATPPPCVFREPSVPAAVRRVGQLAARLQADFGGDGLERVVKEPERALGRMGGRVEWVDGVGRLVGGEEAKVGGEENGVHMFLDHSNILNGLLSTSPTSPLLPKLGRRVLSLPSLTLLLSHGRPTAGMHLVGSSPLTQDLDIAVRLGWECCILKRVSVPLPRRGGGARVIESTTDDSDAPRSVELGGIKMREQAVDELLHLKILQTLLKHKPGIMVLATGDAKGGQYNADGFLGCVREAVGRGWKVELWSFRQGLSRAWKETARREGWKGFRVVEMDGWGEELGDWEVGRVDLGL